jgi:CheY-like chemotaxis protein
VLGSWASSGLRTFLEQVQARSATKHAIGFPTVRIADSGSHANSGIIRRIGMVGFSLQSRGTPSTFDFAAAACTILCASVPVPFRNLWQVKVADQRSILVVDVSESFAQLIRLGLEPAGHHVTTVLDGESATQALRQTDFDLAIVDAELREPDGTPVVRRIRWQLPNLRLMVILLAGESMPPELTDLEVHSILPKPFFLPDLPAMVETALETPFPASGEDAEPAHSEAPRPSAGEAADSVPAHSRVDLLRQCTPQIMPILLSLAREVSASTVLLSCGPELVAHVGPLPPQDAAEVARVVAEEWDGPDSPVRDTGQELLRFQPGAGRKLSALYSIALDTELMVAIPLKSVSALSQVRHRALSAMSRLRELLSP